MSTILETIEATQEMLTEGDRQLAELQEHIDDLEQRIGQRQSELADISASRVVRTTQLQEARTLTRQKEDEHTQAVDYAKLAQGTLNERSTVQAAAAAKKTWYAAKKEQERIEREHAEAEQIAAAREAELRQQLHLLQFEKETREAELQGVSRSRGKAHTELGAIKLQAIQEQIALADKHIDELRSHLLAAQVARQEIVERGLEDLQPWQDHFREVQRLAPVREDGYYRMVRAAHYYVSAVAEETTALPNNPTVALPDLPADPEWRQKISSIVATLPELGKLRNREGHWQDLGSHRAQDFLSGYGDHLNSQHYS
jgi:chromosome segregation ATPase